MVGAAVRGLSKILRKTGKKRPRGTPTAAGLAHRRNLLRGAYPAKSPGDKYRKLLGDPSKKLGKAPKKPSATKAYLEGVATGTGATALTALYLKSKKAKKEAKAKEDKDLKKATEKHEKKTKEKRKKYGKHHG